MPTNPPTRATRSSKTPKPESAGTTAPDEARVDALRSEILRHLKFTLARDPHTATTRDWWISTAMAVRDLILERFIGTMGVHNGNNVRRLYYLSLEYLMGRLLENNLYNRQSPTISEK